MFSVVIVRFSNRFQPCCV